jgi:hypothetical protein
MPIGVIVSVIAFSKTEKGIGVVVIPVPSCAQDVEIPALSGSKVGLPFLIVELNLDAELFFPDLLNGDCKSAV